MTPQQFMKSIKEEPPAPAYLFLGPEPYQREVCRRALLRQVLPEADDRESGFTRHDLEEQSLSEVIDDARSPSLFVSKRVILAANAEHALPRTRGAAADDDEAGAAKDSGTEALARYMQDPAPGVVLVLDSAAFGFQGEDKKKSERVRQFYAVVPAQVEFPHLTPSQARQLAESLARRSELRIGPAEIEILVESLGGEGPRIASEIEKLRLYAGPGKQITAKDIAELIPDARETTIFALVEALGRDDRVRSLHLLDALVRQGEYLPLALSFLATQFRLALAAKEAGLRSASQLQGHFAKAGVPMWPSRAEQVWQTASSFNPRQCAEAMRRIFAADRALRDARPDDRVVMEEFVLALTAGGA